MMSIHGYCKFCKDSIYPDDEYVCRNENLYHVECAEAVGIPDYDEGEVDDLVSAVRAGGD